MPILVIENSPGVGPFSEDRENNDGTRLRAFAAQYNMAFMNTYMDGVPLSTWRSSRGQEHRIDYTAISMKDAAVNDDLPDVLFRNFMF